MTTFWIAALIILILVLAVLLWPVLRRRAQDTTPEGNADIQVYRDQLAEVESDVAKGVLSPDAAERTRTEISRRILDADKTAHAQDGGPTRAPLIGTVLASVLVLGLGAGAFGIYQTIGANGEADLPLTVRRAKLAEAQANRPSQESVEARIGDDKKMEAAADPDYRALVSKLRKALKDKPDDLRGQKLLAEHEARIGHFAAASRAQGRVVKLKGKNATAGDYTDLAELLIVAAGGYVSPVAERALGAAIDMDRTNSRARYYSGLDLAQNGRPDLAYRLWNDLLNEGPVDAPWIAPIQSQIADVARMAGIRMPPPDARPAIPATPGAGPTQEQVNNARNMTAAQRQDLIKSMVARLSERLNGAGGSAAEWAKLINAYGVLGDHKKAGEATDKARAAYAGDPAALALINRAASNAGIAD